MQNAVARYTANILEPFFPDSGKTMAIRLAPNLTIAAGTVLGQITSAAVNAVQTLTVGGTPTGGTFTITYSGQTTTAIPYNATAAQVQAALVALSNIGAGQVVCTGGPLPGSTVICTFAGMMAGIPINAMTASAAGLTGGTPTSTFAQTTTGVASGRFAAYASGNSDGTQLPKVIAGYDFKTDDRGNVIYSATTTTPEWSTSLNTLAYFQGAFRVGDLTGLDANASAGANAFGRLINGALANTEAIFLLY